MKIKITLKDPDGVYEAVQEAVEASVATSAPELEDEEAEKLIELRRIKAHEALAPWIKRKEYVTVEFDTDAKTAAVLPAV